MPLGSWPQEELGLLNKLSLEGMPCSILGTLACEPLLPLRPAAVADGGHLPAPATTSGEERPKKKSKPKSNKKLNKMPLQDWMAMMTVVKVFAFYFHPFPLRGRKRQGEQTERASCQLAETPSHSIRHHSSEDQPSGCFAACTF